jgi:hypothetical protein
MAFCQFNLDSYNKTEGRGKWEGRPFRNHSKGRRNRTRGRYGWRGEKRPQSHDEERRNKLFGNEGRSYYDKYENNSNDYKKRPYRRRESRKHKRFNFVQSFMNKAVSFYPDAFGAKIINNYTTNTTCESYKQEHQGCCINGYYVGKEDCRYLYIFSVSLVVVLVGFSLITCCCSIGCFVLCCIIMRRRKRHLWREKHMLRSSNCMGIPVGNNVNNQVNNNINHLQQNSNLLNNEAVPSNRIGEGHIKIIQRNQRVFDQNDFKL